MMRISILQRLREHLQRSRPGVTLVELLLFVVFLGFISLIIVDLLLLASDSQARQRVATDIDQSGIQMSQLLSYQVRHAERILAPAPQESGSVLFLQMSDSESNPTGIGISSGVLMLIEKSDTYPVSDPQMIVEDFKVWNTSPDAERPSVRILFTLSRRIPIPLAERQRQSFDMATTVFPDDVLDGEICGTGATICAGLSCRGDGYWEWGICNSGECSATSGALLCSP